jgi:hypothetical protein
MMHKERFDQLQIYILLVFLADQVAHQTRPMSSAVKVGSPKIMEEAHIHTPSLPTSARLEDLGEEKQRTGAQVPSRPPSTDNDIDDHSSTKDKMVRRNYRLDNSRSRPTIIKINVSLPLPCLLP